MKSTLPLVLLCLLPLAAAHAETPPEKSPACAAAEFHQFDFWIGDWDVTNPQGKPAGRNRIEAVVGGCAISEDWTGAGGTDGKSHSAWDARNKRWNQYWVDTDGTALFLSGEFKEGRMVLGGDQVDPATGKRAPQRVTWTPNKDGSVRQLWEGSDDGGKTWATVFDGLYRKR